jgi:serine/threonine-protein kinase
LRLPLCPRFRFHVHQVAAEIYASRDPAFALHNLKIATAESMIDVEWFELCPAVDSLRATPEFLSMRKMVRDRAAAMWAASTE